MFKTLLKLEARRLFQNNRGWSLFLSFGFIAIMLLSFALTHMHLDAFLNTFLFYIVLVLSLFLIHHTSLSNDYQTGFLTQIYLRLTTFWPYVWSHLFIHILFFTFLGFLLLGCGALFFHFDAEHIINLSLLILMTFPSLIVMLYLSSALTLTAHIRLPFPLIIGPFLLPLMIAALSFLENSHNHISIQTPLLLCTAFLILSFTVLPHVCHFLLKETLDS